MTAYRAWHISNIPGTPFRVEVDSLSKAKLVLDTLAFYDLHLEATGIRGDYSNVGGIEMWEDGEWVDHEDYDGDADAYEVRRLPDGSFSQLKFEVNSVPPSIREQIEDYEDEDPANPEGVLSYLQPKSVEGLEHLQEQFDKEWLEARSHQAATGESAVLRLFNGETVKEVKRVLAERNAEPKA